MEECSQRKWEHSPIPFEMGKYSECSTMLDVVYAEKNVEGTFQVVRQLLENVESIGDFSGFKIIPASAI